MAFFTLAPINALSPANTNWAGVYEKGMFMLFSFVIEWVKGVSDTAYNNAFIGSFLLLRRSHLCRKPADPREAYS
jgi:hypothetical protein